MEDYIELTAEEKEKLKKVLAVAGVFALAFFGAKCGAKSALKDLKIDVNLITESGIDTFSKLR